MKKRYVVILIAGSTNGGKTSLSDRLIEEFPNSILLKQDDYYLEPDDPKHLWITLSNNIKHQDWERYESIDWLSLDKTLMKLDDELKNSEQIECIKNEQQSNELNQNLDNLELIKSKVKLVLIEGHAILCHKFPDFLDIDLIFFFTLSLPVSKARRLTRTYIPNDPPKYFEEIVWPTYLEHLSMAKKNYPDAIFLNGELDRDVIYNKVKKEINQIYSNLV